VFVCIGENRHHELAGQPVGALAPDGHGGALAIVSGHALRRRTPDGKWITLATSEVPLSCCVSVGDVIYVGTDDARVLRVGETGDIEPLRGFEAVAGRDTWYAGSAVIDGQRVGPPLGIRSITVTADRRVLLANVHVGGIPRSTDGGATWHATIDIDTDVHEVCAHPTDPGIVIAAAAVGLCVSHDGGATWTVEQDGLHASYCSAVAFLGNDTCRGRIHRPLREAGCYLSTTAGPPAVLRARRRPATMDRWHRRHPLHRHAGVSRRSGGSGRQPLALDGQRTDVGPSR
jgi:hypothetical protein